MKRTFILCGVVLVATTMQIASTVSAQGARSENRAALSRSATPEQLFALVAPGMVYVSSSCDSGDYSGSGFLVGPQTMVTALHVLRDQDGTSCVSRARQEGTGRTASIDGFVFWRKDDLAVAHLSAPLDGFYFKIASSSPHLGERVIGLGYSLGNPLSLNQGTVSGLNLVAGIPVIDMNLFGGHGSSGGPILDLAGKVVGLTQLGQTTSSQSTIWSIDLGSLSRGGTRMCQGVAKDDPNTLCGSIGPGAISSPTTPPGTAKPSAAEPTPVIQTIAPRAFDIHYSPSPFFDNVTVLHLSFKTTVAAPKGERYYVFVETLVKPLPKTCDGGSAFGPLYLGGKNLTVHAAVRSDGILSGHFCPGPAEIVVLLNHVNRTVGSFGFRVYHRHSLTTTKPAKTTTTTPTVTKPAATKPTTTPTVTTPPPGPPPTTIAATSVPPGRTDPASDVTIAEQVLEHDPTWGTSNILCGNGTRSLYNTAAVPAGSQELYHCNWVRQGNTSGPSSATDSVTIVYSASGQDVFAIISSTDQATHQPASCQIDPTANGYLERCYLTNTPSQTVSP